MANEVHLKILKRGVRAWNDWRRQILKFIPISTARVGAGLLCLENRKKQGCKFEGHVIADETPLKTVPCAAGPRAAAPSKPGLACSGAVQRSANKNSVPHLRCSSLERKRTQGFRTWARLFRSSGAASSHSRRRLGCTIYHRHCPLSRLIPGRINGSMRAAIGPWLLAFS